jgi:hypothetical protein
VLLVAEPLPVSAADATAQVIAAVTAATAATTVTNRLRRISTVAGMETEVLMVDLSFRHLSPDSDAGA